MTKNQITFKRTSVPHVFKTLFSGIHLFDVERVIVEGKIRWQANEDIRTISETREQAAEKFYNALQA